MPPRMTALVTGAAGGLGRAFASALAAKNYDLIMVDVQDESLNDLARQIESRFSVRADTVRADLTSRSDLERLADMIAERDNLEVLVNNAGFGIRTAFSESDLRKNIDMIDVHIIASVWLSRAALVGMNSRGKGYIINVSSIGGFRPGAGAIVYGATKRFLIHFSSSLQAELRSSGIRVQALCPGYVNTDFHGASANGGSERPKVPAFFWMDPKDVVSKSLLSIERGRVTCIPGFKSHCLLLMLYMPPIVGRVVRALARRIF